MGAENWNKVIKFLKTSNAKPQKVLNMLKTVYSKRTVPESDFEMVRNSWAYIVVGSLANKYGTKNKEKKIPFTQVIRNWVNSKDYQNAWCIFHLKKGKKKINELSWEQSSHDDFKKIPTERHVKQLNDIWVSKIGKKIRSTLTPAGKFPISDHSKKFDKILYGE